MYGIMSNKTFYQLENSMKQAFGSNNSKKKGNKEMKNRRNKYLRQMSNDDFHSSLTRIRFGWEF